MPDDTDMEALLRTKDGVKQVFDRVEAELIAEARAVLRAERPKAVPLRMSLKPSLKQITVFNRTWPAPRIVARPTPEGGVVCP
jgi:hypothetical protein